MRETAGNQIPSGEAAVTCAAHGDGGGRAARMANGPLRSDNPAEAADGRIIGRLQAYA